MPGWDQTEWSRVRPGCRRDQSSLQLPLGQWWEGGCGHQRPSGLWPTCLGHTQPPVRVVQICAEAALAFLGQDLLVSVLACRRKPTAVPGFMGYREQSIWTQTRALCNVSSGSFCTLIKIHANISCFPSYTRTPAQHLLCFLGLARFTVKCWADGADF